MRNSRKIQQVIFPALLVNKPIAGKEQDVFHVDAQIEELDEAINCGANFIGIFSEFYISFRESGESPSHVTLIV